MKIEKHGSIVVPELEEASRESGRSKSWTEEEEGTMKEYYIRLAAKGNIKKLAKHLGRTMGSVNNKAGSMGLRSDKGKAA
jgi:hypothetical protein